jgi:hypothetical protein
VVSLVENECLYYKVNLLKEFATINNCDATGAGHHYICPMHVTGAGRHSIRSFLFAAYIEKSGCPIAH